MRGIARRLMWIVLVALIGATPLAGVLTLVTRPSVGAVVVASIVGGFVILVGLAPLLLVRMLGKGFVEPPVAGMREPTAGELYVVSCSPAAENTSYAAYTMTAVLRGRGIEPRPVQRDGYAYTGKWPTAGVTLPITVDRSDPDTFRIEWDNVPTVRDRARAEAEQIVAAGPV